MVSYVRVSCQVFSCLLSSGICSVSFDRERKILYYRFTMIITVCNLKGGVGKTCIAVNLAAALGAVLVDSDFQASASEWNAVKTLFLPLEEEKYSKEWIARVKRISPPVVIDTPPHIGFATQAALLISDIALIPLGASMSDFRATQKVIDLLKHAQGLRSGKPEALLIPSRIDRRTASGREIEEALKVFGLPVGPVICLRSAFADSTAAGVWVGEYAPGSKAHEEILKLVKVVNHEAS